MPGFDGTGPAGEGPLTGGGRGGCAPSSRGGVVRRFLNRGAPRSGTGRPRWGLGLRLGLRGRGRGGRGRGRRR